MIRLANIADLFDGVPPTAAFNIRAYAEALFKRANNQNTQVDVEIIERTLGNNMDFDKVDRY